MRRGVEATGGFDTQLDRVEDWDLWLQGFRQGAVVKLDLPFVRYTNLRHEVVRIDA